MDTNKGARLVNKGKLSSLYYSTYLLSLYLPVFCYMIIIRGVCNLHTYLFKTAGFCSVMHLRIKELLQMYVCKKSATSITVPNSLIPHKTLLLLRL